MSSLTMLEGAKGVLEQMWKMAFEKRSEIDSPERSRCRATRCLPGEIAPYVLLPGDPSRALMIAQSWLDDASLVMANREFHSYTGTYKGVPVSVISTGLGSPGASMVVQDLPKLNVRAAIRVGTAGTADPTIRPGDVLVATGAVRDEGSSKKHLPECFPAVADLNVTNALLNAGRKLTDRISYGIVSTSDGFSFPSLAAERDLYSSAGVRAFEMEAAAVMILAQVNKIAAGCILSIDGYVADVAKGNTQPSSELRDKGINIAINAALDAILVLAAQDA